MLLRTTSGGERNSVPGECGRRCAAAMSLAKQYCSTCSGDKQIHPLCDGELVGMRMDGVKPREGCQGVKLLRFQEALHLEVQGGPAWHLGESEEGSLSSTSRFS